MSDSEPISKRLRKRSVPTVTGTSQSTAKKPASNDSKCKKSFNEQVNTVQSNSLFGLSDGCLEKLFGHLDIETLCRMANVCKRFRKISEKTFGKLHKEFTLQEHKCNNSTFRQLLCKFGHLITTMNASVTYYGGRAEIDADAIAKYCTKNLEKLSLTVAKINCAAFKPIFTKLKALELDCCDFVGDKHNLFSNCPKHENLYFESCAESDEFIAQKFPKLTGLIFDSNWSSYGTFFKLLSLNPQLLDLHIMAMADDAYISFLVKNMKNLERLMIRPNFMSSTPEIQTRSVFLQLAKLKKLKKLAIDAGDETYAKLFAPLMKAFDKEKITLDELDVRDFEIGSKEIKSITSLKTLEVLSLERVEDVSSSDLVSLTADLPLLTKLVLFFWYSLEFPASTTFYMVTKMIKSAKQLEFFALIAVRNLQINQKEFETLVKEVQSRGTGKTLTIEILGCKTTTSFNVPENVQQASAKHLKIIYEEDIYDACECDTCEENYANLHE